MDGRKKPIVLSKEEYRKLELARIRYENQLQRRVTGFGEVVAFLADNYLNEKGESSAQRK